MPIAQHKNKPFDYERASELRRVSSDYEKILWQELRKLPLKFRRQHPIHPYIADFVCLKHRIVIELDGNSHDNTQDYDTRRDLYMKRLGYKILRIHNDEIKKNLEGVLLTIIRETTGMAHL